MREIKFRGKRVDNGEWVYGDLLHHDNRVGMHNQLNDGTMSVCDVNTDTVGQFTGLLDKNGKEIYEGDIVEAWSAGVKAIGKVTQRIDGLWLIYPAWQNKRFYYFQPNGNGEDSVEIIGNIYDNPELLEVSQ